MGQGGGTLHRTSHDGEVIGTYQGKYLGSMSVPYFEGADIVYDAVGKVLERRRRANGKEGEKRAAITVSTTYVLAREKGSHNSVLTVPIRHISFTAVDPRNARVMSIIFYNPEDPIITCHVLKIKKGAAAVLTAIHQAKETQSQASNPSLRVSHLESEEPSSFKRKKSDAKFAPIPIMLRTATDPDMIVGEDDIHQQEAKNPQRLSTSSAVLARYSKISVDFSGTFVGRKLVRVSTGDDVVEEAIDDILMKKKQTSVKCTLTLQEDCLILTKRGKDTRTLAKALYSDISYCYTDRKHPKWFAFITMDSNQVMFCVLLELDKKAQDVADAVDEAILKEEAIIAAKRKESHAVLSAKTTAHLGVFECLFLGTTPVASRKGQAICDEAVEKFMPNFSKSNMTPAVVVVTGEGIKIVDSSSSDIIGSVFIENVSFTSVVPMRRLAVELKIKTVTRLVDNVFYDDTYFVFLSPDNRLETITCYIFMSLSPSSDICLAINEAFKIAYEEQQRTKGNPFRAAEDEPRGMPHELLRAYQVHRGSLKPVSVLGTGQFGQVYLAQQHLSHKDAPVKTNASRAVKVLRDASIETDREGFLREAENMLYLHHPHLVQFVGVAVQQSPWLLVMEYMMYGDLRSALRACDDKHIVLTYTEQLHLVIQIASGMEYLSSLRFIHMDLALRNCLLHSQSLVKVADFGLTRRLKTKEDSICLRERIRLPIKWLAIESMDDRLFSIESDVWAFGILLWEISSYGIQPYEGVSNLEVQKQVRDGFRLSAPSDYYCPSEFYGLMSRCWEATPSMRPSFTDIMEKLALYAAHAKTTSGSNIRDVGLLINSGSSSSTTLVVHQDYLRLSDATHPAHPHARTMQELRSTPALAYKLHDPLPDYDFLPPLTGTRRVSTTGSRTSLLDNSPARRSSQPDPPPVPRRPSLDRQSIPLPSLPSPKSSLLLNPQLPNSRPDGRDPSNSPGRPAALDFDAFNPFEATQKNEPRPPEAPPRRRSIAASNPYEVEDGKLPNHYEVEDGSPENAYETPVVSTSSQRRRVNPFETRNPNSFPKRESALSLDELSQESTS